MTSDTRGTAVVIGGGLAGCFAAQALVGLFERIVVIERDRYPEQPGFRAGVPQGRHAHLLMEGGRRAIEELLPGLDVELLARGAVAVPLPGGLSWLSAGGWMPHFDTGLAFLSCTRPMLDDTVLRRLRSEPSVEFQEATEVVGLLGDPAAVTGVRLRARRTTGRAASHTTAHPATASAGSTDAATDSAAEQELPAALVVDASGRSSRLPQWLLALGCPPVAEERVDAGIGYSSRLFERPPGVEAARSAVYVQTKAPDHPRMGVLLPVEDGRWMVSVGGMRDAAPEPGEAGFDQHLRLLRDPVLHDLLATTEPTGPVRGFRPGAGVRRHYERDSPLGLVVLGDAACTFDPVYGQGISVAAFGALALRDGLRQHGSTPGAARRAQKLIAATVKDAWLMSSAEDVRFPTTVGGPSGALLRLQHGYLDRVISAASRDESVCTAFCAVMTLMRPPTALFRPSVLWAVLRPHR